MFESTLPPIRAVPVSSLRDRTRVLDLLFEPCSAIHDSFAVRLQERPFNSYAELVDFVGGRLNEWANTSKTDSRLGMLDGILSAHPRLGEKKVDSAQSRAEQAQLQGSAGEGEELMRLNEEYEAKFPGLRYVYVALRGIHSMTSMGTW